MQEYDLNNTLKECKKGAETGYTIASSHLKLLQNSLMDSKGQLQKTISDIALSKCFIPGTTEMLQQQLFDIEQAFDNLFDQTSRDVELLRNSLSKFSITLFGRTMAGKSTLMEILKQGDGASIGKGAQRTTRDIRNYEWNGLSITDVPGIGAFEGKDDERIAFEAAKSADLILFLITDDAPQFEEAKCLGKILTLGKPVLCVINVKSGFPDNEDLILIKDQLDKAFDLNRLNEIKTQFLAFEKLLGQDWGYIPFVYTHLRSAFLAQKAKDTERQKALDELSRISYLKAKIIETVKNKGRFYRIRTFIDAISHPMLSSTNTLLAQSQLNSGQGRTILNKRRAFEEWRIKFESDSKLQAETLISKIQSQLNAEVAAFAENHFDDNNADKAWMRLLEKKRLDAQCQQLLDVLAGRCDEKIKEISRELSNELKFTTKLSYDKLLKMDKIIDGKKIWNWTTLSVTGIFTGGSLVAFLLGSSLAGPLGWIAAGVGVLGFIGSLFFKSRQKKEYEARRRLEENLKKNITSVCNKLSEEMLKQVELLTEQRIVAFIKELDRMNVVIFRLADTQKHFAWALNRHLLALNRHILEESADLIGFEGINQHIKAAARIPGHSITIMLSDGDKFPEEQQKNLQKLIGEKIGFVYFSENKKILISRIIGKAVDRNAISIEEKISVAHINAQITDANTLNRIKLAQQLCEVIIIAE